MTVEIHKSPVKKTTAGQEKQEHIFEIKFIHNKKYEGNWDYTQS